MSGPASKKKKNFNGGQDDCQVCRDKEKWAVNIKGNFTSELQIFNLLIYIYNLLSFPL